MARPDRGGVVSALLDVGVIDAAVDLLATGGWVQGRRETSDGRHCAHGAVLATACTPGDAFMWQVVMRHTGLTAQWNDTPGRTATEVSERLATLRDVTADDMIEVFGPNWIAVRDLVRRAAKLTEDEAAALAEATDTAATVDARDIANWAASDGANWAALNAANWTALNAANSAAWDATWGAHGDVAGDASAAAGDAARAVAVRDRMLSTPEGARHYATLTGPWASVIGPAHPDDTPGVSNG